MRLKWSVLSTFGGMSSLSLPQAAVVHCPSSNFMLSSGVANVRRYLTEGIKVCLIVLELNTPSILVEGIQEQIMLQQGLKSDALITLDVAGYDCPNYSAGAVMTEYAFRSIRWARQVVRHLRLGTHSTFGFVLMNLFVCSCFEAKIIDGSTFATALRLCGWRYTIVSCKAITSTR